MVFVEFKSMKKLLWINDLGSNALLFWKGQGRLD